MLVHLVIGQFHLLEGYHLLPQLFAGIRRIRVGVHPAGSWRICFTRYQPGGTMISVAIPLIVHGNDVQEYGVPLVRFYPSEGHPNRGKHPPTTK